MCGRRDDHGIDIVLCDGLVPIAGRLATEPLTNNSSQFGCKVCDDGQRAPCRLPYCVSSLCPETPRPDQSNPNLPVLCVQVRAPIYM
jgi:hypothetical protein